MKTIRPPSPPPFTAGKKRNTEGKAPWPVLVIGSPTSSHLSQVVMVSVMLVSLRAEAVEGGWSCCFEGISPCPGQGMSQDWAVLAGGAELFCLLSGRFKARQEVFFFFF